MGARFGETRPLSVQLQRAIGLAFATVNYGIAYSPSMLTTREDFAMRYGTVVQFNSVKGFGFIRPYFGPDVFFHVTALGACVSKPQIEPGQPVKYELVPDSELKPPRLTSQNRQPNRVDEPLRPQAKFVELIDRLPGADLEKQSVKLQSPRHPRARKKKPTWRR